MQAWVRLSQARMKLGQVRFKWVMFG